MAGMDWALGKIAADDHAGLSYADFRSADDLPPPQALLVDYKPPPAAPTRIEPPQSPIDPCAKTDGQWRLPLGCDAQHNFNQGKPTVPGVQWKAEPPAEPAPPAAESQPKEAPSVGYRPTRVELPKPAVDVNQNGGSDIKVPEFHPSGKPGATQVANAGPVSAEKFWRDEDERIEITGRKIGHHTYNPTGYLIGAGLAGSFGESALPFILARSSRNILRNVPSADETGGETRQPGMRERWARNYRANYDTASKPREDLEYTDDRAKFIASQAEHEQGIRKNNVLQADLSKSSEAGGKVSPDLAEYAKTKGVDLTTPNAAELEARKSLLARTLNQEELDLRKSAASLRWDEGAIRQAYSSAKPGVGLYGGARGMAAVGLSMVLDHYLDRAPSLLPDKVTSALGLEQRDPKMGISSSVGSTALVPLAYSLDVAGRAGVKGGWNFVLNGGVAVAAALGAELIGGKISGFGLGLDSYLGTSELPTASDRFTPNMIDMVNIGLAAGFPAPKQSTRLALTGMGWLDARAYAAPGIPGVPLSAEVESLGWGALALGTSTFVPKGMRGLAVAGTVASVGFGELNRIFNPKPDFARLNTQAWDALKEDESKRTAASMNAAVDSFDRLSARSGYDDSHLWTQGSRDVDDGAVWSYENDWMRQGKSFEAGNIEKYRGEIILATSLGESRLSRGSTPDDAKDVITNKHMHADFVPGLEGKELDIGSEALLYLNRASTAINNAVSATTAEDGKEHHGKVVSKDAEIAELKTVRTRVNGDIAKIIDRAHSRDTLGAAIDAMAEYNVGNAKKLDNLYQKSLRILEGATPPADAGNDYYKKVVAKSARDIAMIWMSESVSAATHNNAVAGLQRLDASQTGNAAGDAQANGGRATDVARILKIAEKYDPNNKDLATLKEIYEEKVTFVRRKALEQRA